MKKDPREVLTEFITAGFSDPDQKTNLTCKEQLAFYDAWLSLGREPGLEFFRQEVEQDMKLMMSLTPMRGLMSRSQQVVEMFKSIDTEESRDVGLQPITVYNRNRSKQGEQQ